MKIFLATAVIVAAIIFGPLATDWLRQPSETDRIVNEVLYGERR